MKPGGARKPFWFGSKTCSHWTNRCHCSFTPLYCENPQNDLWTRLKPFHSELSVNRFCENKLNMIHRERRRTHPTGWRSTCRGHTVQLNLESDCRRTTTTLEPAAQNKNRFSQDEIHLWSHRSHLHLQKAEIQNLPSLWGKKTNSDHKLLSFRQNSDFCSCNKCEKMRFCIKLHQIKSFDNKNLSFFQQNLKRNH